MLGLGKIFDFIGNFDLTRLEVKKELCLNNLFNKRICTKCYDVCPCSVINDRLEVKKDSCNSCGFCYQVCPTGVFNILEGSNAKLTSEIKNLANKESRIKIYCSQHKQKIKGGLEVVCLGRLDEKLLLEGLLSGVSDIWVVDPNCTDCEMQVGERLFKEILSACQELLHVKSINNRIYYTKEEPIKEQKDSLNVNQMQTNSNEALESSFNRRDLFKIFKKEVKDSSAKKQKTEQFLPLRQARLLNLLLALDIKEDKLQQIIANNFPRLEFSLDCDFCQGCSHLCPTNALKVERREESLNFNFNPLLCTSCQLCERSCFYNAVKLTKFANAKEVKLKEIDLKKHFQIFSGHKAKCQSCGDKFYTARDRQEVCFDCQYVEEITNSNLS